MIRLIKTLHIVFACFWLGTAASVVVLQCARGWSEDNRQLSSLNVELAALDASLIIPGAIGSLLTGTLICKTTTWHFIRYRWVIAKWVGTLCGILLGTVLLGPWQIQMVNLSGELDGPPITGGSYDLIRLPFTVIGFLQVYLLIAMIAISVLKPWGKHLPKQEKAETAGASDPSRPFSIRSFARKAGRMILIFVSILLACILILMGFLQLQSPGKPGPYVDANGKTLPNSLSEKVRVDINGVKQGMFIKSRDVSHPVLLYLHGGMPDYFLTEKYPTGLEDLFTVCYWEQRGAGLSYDPNAPRDAINTEQMISDTLALTNYLRQRFGNEKIYLMGHSGGSFFGIQAAARAPELYYAYIGEAQMTDQLESERLAYEYMLAQYRANGNQKMVQRLEAAPVTLQGGTPAGYLALRDEAMHPLGIGTLHGMKSVVTGLVLPSLLSRDYTLPEKLNFWRAKAQSGASAMWPELISTDLRKQMPELAIPVYFFEGIYDYTCSYTLAKSYYQSLKAPVKGFYTFAQSAHSPMFEEPEKMQQILREDVLAGANRLADAD